MDNLILNPSLKDINYYNDVERISMSDISISVAEIIKNANLTYNIEWMVKNELFPDQPEEFFYGCREYKRHIIDETEYPKNIDKNQQLHKFINKKATQMLFRLNEGGGRALYIIGVEDNGFAIGITKSEVITTLINFINMANIISCIIKTFNIYKTSTPGKYICTSRVISNYKIDTIALF